MRERKRRFDSVPRKLARRSGKCLKTNLSLFYFYTSYGYDCEVDLYMENYIYKTNELYHHGIKGMKWGIRRYQNKDGSLTDAGKKRLVSRVQRADKWDDPDKVARLTNKAFANYKKTSKSYQTALASKNELAKVDNEINKRSHAYAEKMVGKKYKDIRDPSDHMKYIAAGQTEMRRLAANKEFMNTKITYDKNYSKAYKDAQRYVEKYLGEYGNLALKNPLSVSVNLKTGSARQQTAAERMAIELMRDAWYGRYR